jgi:hypothetical protein
MVVDLFRRAMLLEAQGFQVHRLRYSKSEMALSLSDDASHTKRTRVVLRDDSLCLPQEKGREFFMGAY